MRRSARTRRLLFDARVFAEIALGARALRLVALVRVQEAKDVQDFVERGDAVARFGAVEVLAPRTAGLVDEHKSVRNTAFGSLRQRRQS